MTKEQITKHKEVMLWFIENPDKGVYQQLTPTGEWCIEYNPIFKEYFKYIQNDEYAELRKKICDLESELSSLKKQVC